MKFQPVFVMLFLLVSIVSAQITIHVYNPWIDDPYRQDSVSISGTNEVGYHPGKKMESEGGGWFSYTFKVAPMPSDGFNFYSFVGNEYDPNAGKLAFPKDADRILFTTLADQFPGSKEFWVIPDDAIGKYKIYDIPPKSKVIHLFNPWPDNSPQAVVGGSSPKKMRVNTAICGWYTYYFSGFIDSLKKVTFTDYYHKYQYGLNGLMGGNPTLDLTPYLTDGDTIYILPKPFPTGPPSISKTFPGRTGECPTRKISAIIRDWKADSTNFFLDKNAEKMHKKMVQNTLGVDGKPVVGPDAALGYGTGLGSWFVTKGNNQTCVDLNFTKGYDGRWEYDSDLAGGFFPIDNFVNLNNIKYPDAHKKQHNFHFTMEMHLQFMYRKGGNQEFVFRGDDDVWIYVNNTLAIDLGGMHEPKSDTLKMDKVSTTLGLTDGGNYSLDIFYAERMPTGSNFLVKTSLDLRNSEELYYKDKLIGAGKTEYNIMQLVKREGIDCGFTPVSNKEEEAIVDFFIDGPQFQGKEVLLTVGTNYGGILVDPNKSKITLDSASYKGLTPGEYKITYKNNADRSGYLMFTVKGSLPALLTADPPGGTHFTGDVTITLSTNSDARIYYTTDGSKPDTNNPAQLYSASFKIDKTLTVNAIATGNDYIPTSNLWIYTRDQEKVTLTADPPSGTHFSDSAKITLTATHNARIYFTVDGSTPNVNDSTQLYTKPFTISETVVVKASAVGYYLSSASGVWEYTRDLPAARLEATPGNGTHFGESLTITLSTDAEEIYYTTDGSTPIVGSKNQLYTSPITVTGNTVNLKAIAVGKKFNSTSKGWNYISDRIPDITANPPSCAFSTPIKVTLSVNDPDAVIHYTTDGTEPTINSDRYTQALQFSATTQLKARAFANNKVSSSILTENYTRNAIPIEAFYFDRNADGTIDSFYVKVDYKAVGNPDSLFLEAYGNQTKRTLLSNQLNLSKDSLSVSTIFEPALPYSKTKTNDAGNGRFGGRFFDKKGFNIQDKVAPVLISAVFEPKLLEEKMSELGTLKVVFSEPVKSIASKQPFLFLQNGVQYSLEMNLISQSGKEATFSVTRAEGIDFPRSGDKVHIAPTQNVQDVFANAQNNPNNIYVPLKVLQQPYRVRFDIGPNPFEPDVTPLPPGNEGFSITSGVKIVADFGADLKSEVGKIKAEISIFDALGNLVCGANSEGTESQIIQFKKVTVQRTKVVFIWSGHNRRGRTVGAGTYLAHLLVTDPSGNVTSFMQKIGVKK